MCKKHNVEASFNIRREKNLFDPTIFDNLKVVIEGAVYDLDSVGSILVTHRSDRVELATMSRDYAIRFCEKEVEGKATAEVQLLMKTEDISAEILEREDRLIGCHVKLVFELEVLHPDQECPQLKELLEKIWEDQPQIIQQLSYTYGEEKKSYNNRIFVDFGRKINEEQIEDMGTFIDHVLYSLQSINQSSRNREGD